MQAACKHLQAAYFDSGVMSDCTWQLTEQI